MKKYISISNNFISFIWIVVITFIIVLVLRIKIPLTWKRMGLQLIWCTTDSICKLKINSQLKDTFIRIQLKLLYPCATNVIRCLLECIKNVKNCWISLEKSNSFKYLTRKLRHLLTDQCITFIRILIEVNQMARDATQHWDTWKYQNI